MANIKRKKNKDPIDENGKEHGEWVIYYNDQLWYRINYVHGILHGLDEEYHEDGTLLYRGYWNMDKQVGYWYYDRQPKQYFLWLI